MSQQSSFPIVMPRIGGRKARAWSSDVKNEKTKLDRALSAENAYMSDSEVRISNHLGGYQRKEVYKRWALLIETRTQRSPPYGLYLRRADRLRTLAIARRIGLGEWAEENLRQCAPSSIATDAQDPGAGESQPEEMLASTSPARLRRNESFSMDEDSARGLESENRDEEPPAPHVDARATGGVYGVRLSKVSWLAGPDDEESFGSAASSGSDLDSEALQAVSQTSTISRKSFP
ncbi:hypothetical protein FOZ63_013327 [Perkinsus olseni]|uniref:Uncharacterized protein n=1 Tax=Perkinsus olseni TaxID=32597 RepID=A0A7J6PZG0_PEROL|nr:hypothetical protein FOZ63_013327 [Perkinsus olseni]KAF4727490.1 hypothetical protein FOZ62_001154 [Perkinsus olseni]